MADDPTELPEDVLEVNGFRRVRGHEYFVEWRDVGSDRVAYVWVEWETLPGGGSGWIVEYEVKQRRGSGFLDYGRISSHGGRDFDDALADAVLFMRRNGSGGRDMSGGITAGADADFDFTQQ